MAKQGSNLRRQLSLLALLATWWAMPVSLGAQLPAFPPESGSSWEYDYILGKDRTPIASPYHRIVETTAAARGDRMAYSFPSEFGRRRPHIQG